MNINRYKLQKIFKPVHILVFSLITLLSTAVSQPYQDGSMIRLYNQSFDPLLAPPAESLLNANRQGDNLYIVQFYKTPVAAMQNTLKSLGANIRTSLADKALIVLMDDIVKSKIMSLSSVRWIGNFNTEYKLAQDVLASTNTPNISNPVRYSILLFKVQEEVQNKIVQRVFALGGEINLKTSSNRMEATLDQATLIEIAKMPEVAFIDKWTPYEDDMSIVRASNGANYVETVAGYTGQGVSGEVSDDGLRNTHQDFQVTAPIFHNSNNIDNDHGTPVYGIVFGSGASDANARGMLPDATPIFSSRYHMFDRAAHVAELVDPSGPYRAVFQTASWGSTRTMIYTTISAEMDQIIFDNDILITQSQSNSGTTDSRPQAWAKNIVAIGGIRGFGSLTRTDDSWGFSASIGPANDGRIKPDLSQFYGSIWTTGNLSDTHHRIFGGTSGATPAAAGHFGILFQMWADGVFGDVPGGPGLNRDVFDSRPHASTTKALMINMAYQYDFTGASHDKTRVHQGWGFPDVQNLYDTAQSYNWSLPILVNEDDLLQSASPADVNSYTLQVDGTLPLKATMVYTDLPGNPSAAVQRINDLTLKATSPSNVVYWGNNGLNVGNWSTSGGTANTIDTVENIFIETPETGTWTIEVIGSEIVQDSHVETAAMDADYALIVTGGTTSNQAPVADAGVDKSVEIGVTATINGTVTDDNFSGNPLTIAWSQISGSGTTTFANISAAVTDVNFSTQGNYTLRLTASDGEFIHFDEVVITVTPPTPNQAPVVNAGADIDTAQINTATQLQGIVTDDGKPIPSTLTIIWSKMSGPGTVTFANNSSEDTTASFADAGTYVLQLSASDGLLATTDTITVTVVDEVLLIDSNASDFAMEIILSEDGAQSFKYGSTGGDDYQITKLVLFLSVDTLAPDGDLIVDIGTGINTGALPNSSVSISPASLDTSAGMTFTTYEIIFPTPIGPVTADTTYYINMTTHAPNESPYFIEYSEIDVYADGTYFLAGADEGGDAHFEIYGTTDTTTSVPELMFMDGFE